MYIYIKSFNRPYFLDRCIESIYRNVKGITRVVVLDDGTPVKYLNVIQEKYPAVEIRRSEFWELKSRMIDSGILDRTKLDFPGNFWYRETRDAQDLFFLLEDDFYITGEINLGDIANFMHHENLLMYKLMWHGSPRQIDAKTTKHSCHHILWGKKRHTSKHFRRLANNTYKLRGIINKLCREKYYFTEFILPFYNFYNVAGAVYRTDYFEYMWRDVKKLNEYHQIFRSLEFYEKNGIVLKVGKSPFEVVKTSWLTSATNEFPNINLEIFPLNKLLNDKWLHNEFDSMHNYPHDYPPQYIAQFLEPSVKIEYFKYIEEFKKPFKFIHCNTDDYGA